MFGVYSFSDVSYSSDSINEFAQLTGIEATTSIGDVVVVFGSAVPIVGMESDTFVGDVTLIISGKVALVGIEASAELGQIRVYGLERNSGDQGYSNLSPSPSSNYQNIAPAPSGEWNDLVT